MGIHTERLSDLELEEQRVSEVRELIPRLPPAMPADLRSPASPLGLVAFGGSERGLGKQENEDHFVLATMRGTLWIEQSSFVQGRVVHGDAVGQVLIVADGGGGERTSQVAVDSIESVVLESLGWLIQDAFVAEELTAALCRADAVLRAMSTLRSASEGVGSTITLAYVVRDLLYIAHAGDSRCYLFRDGTLTQLTRDHSVQVPLQALGPEDPFDRPIRLPLSNAIGGEGAGVLVELHKLELLEDDVLLLCTDGLSDLLDETRISAVLACEVEPARACRVLLDAALDAGAEDDMTAIVARFGEVGVGLTGA